MILPIKIAPDPILTAMAIEVTKVDDSIKALIADMIETMRAENGLGLAAPQVGRGIRLCVLESIKGKAPIALVNPKITARTGRHVGPEGCLSVPNVVATRTRASHVTVRALDRNGKEIKLRLEGLSAIVAQHEIDHLNGILID